MEKMNHDACFCANCDEYLPETISARVKLLERFYDSKAGDIINVCDWCAKALIEDEVAEEYLG